MQKIEQEWALSSFCQRFMEFDVEPFQVVDVNVSMDSSFREGFLCLLYRLHLIGPCASSGFLGGEFIKSPPNHEELHYFGTVVPEPLAKGPRIVIGVTVGDETASALLNVDEADGLESADGFSNAHPAHAQHLAEPTFRGKLIARSVVPAADSFFKLGTNLNRPVDALYRRERRGSPFPWFLRTFRLLGVKLWSRGHCLLLSILVARPAKATVPTLRLARTEKRGCRVMGAAPA